MAKNVRIVLDNDGAILLDVRRGRYYSLTKVGAAICEGIGAKRPIDLILQELQARFDVNGDRLVRDVQGFIDVLREKGLVVPMDMEVDGRG